MCIRDRDSRPALSTARTSYRKVWPVAGGASTKDRVVSRDVPLTLAQLAALSRRYTRYPARSISLLAVQRRVVLAVVQSYAAVRPVGASGLTVSTAASVRGLYVRAALATPVHAT